jgi:UDP-3-O-[3-hydroxymyristoyl] glucosamine N-acyltransferase
MPEIREVKKTIHTTARVSSDAIILGDIVVGKDCKIDKFTRLEHLAAICDGVTIGQYNHIGTRAIVGRGSRLGDFLIIGKHVNIGKHCIIDDDVVIGDHVTILSGAIIGMGCRISNSVKIGKNVIIKDFAVIYPGACLIDNIIIPPHEKITVSTRIEIK